MGKSVKDAMTSEVKTATPSQSLTDAAKLMKQEDVGSVPVVDGNRLVGVLTDRDIVVRGIADGRDPRATTLGDVCSRNLTTLSPDDQLETAVRLIREHAIRRLPVVRRGRAVGILTMGDLAMQEGGDSALADVSAAPPNV